jgi:DNA-binding NarL/FixJ family response regulator
MAEQMATHQPASTRGRARIVLADDHAVMRHGLKLLLDAEPEFEVVEEVGDLAAVRRSLREHRPSVLLLDLDMPGGSTLNAIPQLVLEAPDTRIVVLTMHSEAALARAVLRAGASAFVVKEVADTELIEAVRRAAAGEPYVSRRLAVDVAVELLRTSGLD